MVYNIRDANKGDIPRLLEISEKAFYKFKLDDQYQYFDKDVLLNNFNEWLDNSIMHIRVIQYKNEFVIGFSLSILVPQFTSNKRHLIEMVLQVDPEMTKMKQGKSLNLLIKDLEDMRSKKDAICVSITISPQFDISKYLIKNGYDKSDTTYIKGESRWH